MINWESFYFGAGIGGAIVLIIFIILMKTEKWADMVNNKEEPKRYLLSENGTCIKAFGHCKNQGTKKCKPTNRDKKHVYCKYYEVKEAKE